MKSLAEEICNLAYRGHVIRHYTTADENCTVVQVDVHDAASPACAAGEKQTRKGVTTTQKGKTAEKRSSSASSVSKQAGGKSSKGLHEEAGNVLPTVRCCR